MSDVTHQQSADDATLAKIEARAACRNELGHHPIEAARGLERLLRDVVGPVGIPKPAGWSGENPSYLDAADAGYE